MTSRTPADSENPEQIEHWNAAAGESWAALSDRLDRLVGPLGEVAMDTLALAGAEHVVDVGCGCGQTAIELSRRIGEWGEVLGVDVSVPMLGVAKSRAARAGLTNVRFLDSDAQTHPFDAGAAKAVFSRFGVMFFSDPVAAFANIRHALSIERPTGFCVLAGDEREPGDDGVPLEAALPHFLAELPAPSA